MSKFKTGERISFTLDITPQAWQRTATFRGRVITPAKTRTFESSVKALAREHAPRELLDGPLILTARFFLPKPKKPKFFRPATKPDLDNLLKSLKDGLNRIIWTDDARVCGYGESTGKYFDESGGPGFIEVEIKECPKELK